MHRCSKGSYGIDRSSEGLRLCFNLVALQSIKSSGLHVRRWSMSVYTLWRRSYVRTMVIHMRRRLVSSARPGKARKVRPVTLHELYGYQITNFKFDIRL